LEAGLGVNPVESMEQFVGQSGQLVGRESAPIGERLAAVHAGPEAAVGKAVVRFGAADVVKEFALCHVPNEADMGGSGVEKAPAIVSAEIAAVPGAAQQRRELPGFAAEEMEDGGELL